ncbi:MAG: CHAT domain-containing protein [Bryobacterales bacterium]|nr:CHAT domain-containing protein [Bryobacterales bacterium]
MLALSGSGQKLYLSGNLLEARAAFESASRAALQARRPELAAQFLNNLGACHIKLFQYRQALDALLRSRELSRRAGDAQTQGISSVNISALYLQMGDVEAAAAAIEDDFRRLDRWPRPGHRARLLLQVGTVRMEQNRTAEAVPLLRRAVREADLAADLRSMAAGFDRLGLCFLRRKDWPEAEASFVEGFRIRKLNRLDETARSLRNLATLKLAMGDLPAAEALSSRAVALALAQPTLASPWTIYHLRGRVYRRQGRLKDALADFRAALELTRRFRLEVLPADSIRALTDVRLDEIYSSFVETAALLALGRNRADLAREAFQAAEENRGASLRALLEEPDDWRSRLPARYWQVLAGTHAAEADVLRSGAAARGRLHKMRNALVEMEYKARSNRPVEGENLVRRAQGNLDARSALFSFHLSGEASFLWALTEKDFRLYRLPPAASLSSRAVAFERAVSNGEPEAEGLGRELYQALFGAVAPHILARPRWLLAPDAQLFRLPFAALVAGTGRQGPEYLVERSALQLIPGAAGWKHPDAAARLRRLSGRFVGVADGIYNRADPRWRQLPGRPALTSDLPRLPAGRREIESCSRAWNAPAPPLLLTGTRAVKTGIPAALAGDSSIIHFAVHVVQAPSAPGGGLIHLVLSPAGPPGGELLSPLEISALRLNGGLVVVNGCSSGAPPQPAGYSPGLGGRPWLASAATPPVLPGNELNRLTRAWLAAGADAVAATRWPSPDEDGRLFSSFYRRLRESADRDPAMALRQAQVEMLASGGWTSSPSYWASFFLVGN